ASAALFAAKAGKKVVLFDDDKGMTRRAWLENHYGVEAISGPDLIEIGKKQAKKFGTELVEDTVTNVTKAETFKVETENNGSFEAKHVLLTTGASTALAEKIGVKLTDGTEPRIKTIIEVDEQGKTNVEGIWAAGT